MPTVCIGGLTERKGARLLSDGRGQPRQRSIRCPSALEGMPRWLGAPCFENSDTALPWGFDTSTFRSGAVVQREHAGPSPRRMSDRNRPASPSRHRIKAVRRVLSPEAGGRYPVAVRGHSHRSAPSQCGVAQRKSGWPLTTVVGGSMPSSAALAPWPRIQVPDCNPGHAGETPAGASIAVVAQWKSVSLPTRRPRGQDPPTAPRGQGVDRYTRGFHPRVMGAVPIDPSNNHPLGSRPMAGRKVLVLEMRVRHLPPEPPERRCFHATRSAEARRSRRRARRAATDGSTELLAVPATPDSGARRLRVVDADEGPLPDDAA